MKRVPQLPPATMAKNLSMAYIRPIAVAEQNLAIAKTVAQRVYWQGVIAAIPVSR